MNYFKNNCKKCLISIPSEIIIKFKNCFSLKKIIFFSLSLLLALFSSSAISASIIDTPHNETNAVLCTDCHTYSLWWQFSPIDNNSQRKDLINVLCDSCHGQGGSAPVVLTHSSDALGTAHRAAIPEWSKGCLDCHDPHFQAQLDWQLVEEDALFLGKGTVVLFTLVNNGDQTTSVDYTALTIKSDWQDTAKWSEKTGAGRGLILTITRESSENTYEIISASSSGPGEGSITVQGVIDPALDGANFGIIYGQLIRTEINGAAGPTDVKFFDSYGGFIDTEIDPPTDMATGVCQVCHSLTNHFHYDDPSPDSDHINVTDLDGQSGASARCTACHLHQKAFGHGGGECIQCHGHDAGYEYEAGKISQGVGTTGSHSTHTENDSDDFRGPNIACSVCHNTGQFPSFKTGTDSNLDGTINLTETDVCNGCHSPGGSFNGVDSTGDSIGAKDNWRIGIYIGDTLNVGKEKWCIGCHDESPAVIAGDSAPDKAGNNSTYGYYVSGHGLDSQSKYQRMYYQEGVGDGNPGADQSCSNCHDTGSGHIVAGANPASRRLKAGYENNSANANCNQCHPPGSGAVASPELYTTSAEFEAGAHGDETKNNPLTDSPLLCTDCHDVHGIASSTYPAMALNSERDLCLGCHQAAYSPPLPVPGASPADHDIASTTACSSCHNPHKPAHGEDSDGGGCLQCHGHDADYEYDTEKFSQGRGSFASHSTHTENDSDDLRGPNISCDGCHDITNFPNFKSGVVIIDDGVFDLTETDVCDTCHSKAGSFDGVDSTDGSVGAKGNWAAGVYLSGSLQSGKEKWCIGCHDQTPSLISGESAADKAGDNSIYGYYVTGHGQAGTYAKLAWQETVATGNPGADKSCDKCHDTTLIHIVAAANPTGSRLKAGYENDQANANCNNCHTSISDDPDPDYYTTSADYENSAHGAKMCTDCHDVHGMVSGAYVAMTTANQESLCYQCHTEGMVQNNAISGSVNDIQEAFSQGMKHDLGTQFTVGGKTYTLECTSCHNVHIVNGKYWDADQSNKTPITRFPPGDAGNLEPWGDEPGEKMDDYAAQASGTGGWAYSIARGGTIAWDQPAKYQPPKKDSGYDWEFAGDKLPDYTSFCQDCHASSGIPGGHGNVNWSVAHGKSAANKPSYVSDSGTAGFWGTSGNPDVLYSMNYVTRGRGSAGHFMRWPYETADRSAGVNFVLSCTDCHEAHGSGTSSMLRSTVNSGSGSMIWNTMCNNCHYYYDGQHAGMSCGNASCHVQNSIHRIDNAGGGGGTALHLTANGYENDYVRPDFTPEIELASCHIGSNEMQVTFRSSQYGAGTSGIYGGSDLTGTLTKDDFWLFDKNGNNPRTITNVTHTAGETTATLTMSAPLVEADLSTDTLAMKPASAWAWYEGGYVNYDSGAIPAQAVSAGPWPVSVSGPPLFNIQSVLYGSIQLKINGIINDSNQIYVTFAESAYANNGGGGDLLVGDFVLSCGGRIIESAAHTAGDSFVILTLDTIVNQSEVGVCTVAAAPDSIFDSYGVPAGTGAVTLTLPPEASVNDLVLSWDFNEGAGSVAGSNGALGTQEDMHGVLTRNVQWVASTKPSAAVGDNAVKLDRISDFGAVQLNYEVDPVDGFPAKYSHVQETQYIGEFSFSAWIKPTALGCQEGKDLGLNNKLRRDVLTTKLWIKNWAIAIMRFSNDGDPINGNCTDEDSTHDVLRFWVAVGDPTDMRCDPWGGSWPETVYPVSPSATYIQGNYLQPTDQAVCDSSANPVLPTTNKKHSFAQTETSVSGAATYGGVALQPGVWQHVVGTWDGRYIRIYIDAQLAAETDMGGTGNYVMLADPLLWGADLVGDLSNQRHVSSYFAAGAQPKFSTSGAPSAGAAYWNTNGFYDLESWSTYVGELDDVKYWKTALPLATIQD